MSRDRSPGGVGDGLPSLPSGEPVLARWFVLSMLVLVPVGLGVVVWAFLSITGTQIGAAERRPPGDTIVTHDRGDAQLGRIVDNEPGPDCAAGVTIVGDEGARAAGRRALSATCQLLLRGDFPEVEAGLLAWAEADGRLRFAAFELTGVDSSARVEEGRVVVELNAKFQFDDATLAAPFVMHELAHLGAGWPDVPVSAPMELAAMQVQARACGMLAVRGQPPRGCRDAEELLAADDPLGELRAAGYRSGGEGDREAG